MDSVVDEVIYTGPVDAAESAKFALSVLMGARSFNEETRKLPDGFVTYTRRLIELFQKYTDTMKVLFPARAGEFPDLSAYCDALLEKIDDGIAFFTARQKEGFLDEIREMYVFLQPEDIHCPNGGAENAAAIAEYLNWETLRLIQNGMDPMEASVLVMDKWGQEDKTLLPWCESPIIPAKPFWQE